MIIKKSEIYIKRYENKQINVVATHNSLVALSLSSKYSGQDLVCKYFGLARIEQFIFATVSIEHW